VLLWNMLDQVEAARRLISAGRPAEAGALTSALAAA
jgi:hypothetical protein